ncbi:MAG TPA: nucleotidyl transferase AbiEii/AbiGii toxin family protein [Chitinophagaceae bacterium]|nr:nucleotidyl transferase AbiEii/AbiGii toxin family protein [Chitinophagaceae bacterium]
MLHFEAVDSPTLELLNKIMAEPLFSPLRLVGGTALALQKGHRKSVDLDLFGEFSVEEDVLTEAVSQMGRLTWLNKLKNIKSLLINGIKVDFVNYTYPWLSLPLNEGNIRLANEKDIAPMKLAAITGRGAKKDFTDLYFLLKDFTLSEMIELYEKKYSDGSAFLVLKSLIYFEDAEGDEMPQMLIPVSWKAIKQTIVDRHRQYTNEH